MSVSLENMLDEISDEDLDMVFRDISELLTPRMTPEKLFQPLTSGVFRSMIMMKAIINSEITALTEMLTRGPREESGHEKLCRESLERDNQEVLKQKAALLNLGFKEEELKKLNEIIESTTKQTITLRGNELQAAADRLKNALMAQKLQFSIQLLQQGIVSNEKRLQECKEMYDKHNPSLTATDKKAVVERLGVWKSIQGMINVPEITTPQAAVEKVKASGILATKPPVTGKPITTAFGTAAKTSASTATVTGTTPTPTPTSTTSTASIKM